MQIVLRNTLAAACLCIFASSSALAAPPNCDTAREGVIVYNVAHKVVQFCNGSSWIGLVAKIGENDTLLGLSCANGEIAKWNGTVWACAADNAGSGGITALTGDVTASGTGSVAATIANSVVSNAKLANMAATTVKGNSTGAAAAAADLTMAQLRTMLGPTGTPGATTFLRGDGQWIAPPSGADNLGNHTATSNIILGANYLSGDGGNEGLRIDANGRILSGSTTAYQTDGVITPQLQMHGLTATASSISSTAWANNSGSPGSVVLSKSRGTAVGTNAAVQNGDVAGQVLFNADHGAGFARAAQIDARIDGTTISSTSMPSALFFMTSATGSTSPSTRMILNALGNVGIGNTAPDMRLHVTGSIKIGDGAEGCNAAAHEGAMRYVAATDAFQMCRNSATGWEAIGTGSGALPALTSANIWVGNGTNVATAVSMSGDATLANTGALTIANSVVSNAKLANMAANTLKGNNTGAAAAPVDVTVAQLRTMLGATGTPSATTFLRGDGQWATTPSGADNLGNHIATQNIVSDTNNTDDLGSTAIRWKDGWFAGTLTAGTFAGSGASLTALPAANLTGTLPAISGANLTALNATNLGSGTVPVARMPALTGDVTMAAGTTATAISAGAVGATELATDAVTNVKVAADAIGIAELSATGTASATTFLRGDNTWAVPSSGGTTVSFQTFTASGTWTKPTGVKLVHVRCWGGGGGGGAKPTWGGGGGGGGAFVTGTFDASILPASVSVTVGAGGVGVSSSSGTNGGASSFGSYLIANGGSRGVGGSGNCAGTSHLGGRGGAVYSFAGGAGGGGAATTGPGDDGQSAGPTFASGGGGGSGCSGGVGGAVAGGGAGGTTNSGGGGGGSGGFEGGDGGNGSTGTGGAGVSPGGGGGGGRSLGGAGGAGRCQVAAY